MSLLRCVIDRRELVGTPEALFERCGTMRTELSALSEREYAPVAQWIRAADFGPSRPVRCAAERGRRSVKRRVICCLSAAKSDSRDRDAMLPAVRREAFETIE